MSLVAVSEIEFAVIAPPTTNVPSELTRAWAAPMEFNVISEPELTVAVPSVFNGPVMTLPLASVLEAIILLLEVTLPLVAKVIGTCRWKL